MAGSRRRRQVGMHDDFEPGAEVRAHDADRSEGRSHIAGPALRAVIAATGRE